MKLLQLIIGIGTTGLAYALSRMVARRYRSPLTTPIFLSTPLVITVLLLSGMQLSDYRPTKDLIVSFLQPAVVALAVPLYKSRHTLRKNIVTASLALVLGSVSTLVIAAGVARLLGLPRVICSSLSLVSATAPAAVEIAPMINADSTLAPAFVLATGMIGAMLGPFLMNKIGVHSPLARGLALGTISHGQGIAQALSEGDVQGAASGIGNALSAILTASVAPILVPVLLR